MATFVLVHGSWAGSVVWRELAPRLRKAGHDVYAPTLTGIGARKQLLNREIDLDTHIQDVIGVIDDADLYDIVVLLASQSAITSGRLKPKLAEGIGATNQSSPGTVARCAPGGNRLNKDCPFSGTKASR